MIFSVDKFRSSYPSGTDIKIGDEYALLSDITPGKYRHKQTPVTLDMCRTNIRFCWLMGSVGGWVFVLDVTSWERRKFYISSAHSYVICCRWC